MDLSQHSARNHCSDSGSDWQTEMRQDQARLARELCSPRARYLLINDCYQEHENHSLLDLLAGQ